MRNSKNHKLNIFNNIKYCISLQNKYCKSTIFIFLISIFTSIGTSLTNIYIPKVVINEIVNFISIKNMLIMIGGICLLKIFFNASDKYLNLYGSALLNIITVELSNLKMLKVLNTDYENIENSKCQNKMQLANDMLWSTGEGSAIEIMIKNIYQFIFGILGYITFSVILSRTNFIIVVFLTILPIINYIVIAKVQQLQHKNRDYTSSLDKKQWYIALNCGAIEAAKDIRIFGMNTWLINMYKNITNERLNWDKKISRKYMYSTFVEAFLILLRDGAAYAILIKMVLKNIISVEEFVLYFSIIGGFADWIGKCINSAIAINDASYKLSGYREFLEYRDVNNHHTKKGLFNNQQCNIQFNNVSYKHNDNSKETIKNISFNIKSGEKIALVGLNGAGKTTLIKCLCGLYTPTTGYITINNRHQKDYNIDEYYSLFSTIFQDYYFLPTTILNIITCDNEKIDETKLDYCLKKSGLYEKINSLDQGIYTKINRQINENGIDLSGGEKQKLLLARALYKNAPILVLDEPTAALDPISEDRIYKQYNELTHDKTAIFISHRLASTKFCDRILFLENGEIVEEGSHEELIKLGGKYAKLYNIQKQYYEKDV